ncbi:MAG TPA: hypothetical protein VE195_04740 [Acidobacteriaceae bacterium]|nr:hypothetical protein [Acidobacteriaceae bacterium]
MSDASAKSDSTQVTISTDTLNALHKIAARQNISLSDALQQAVNVSQLLVDAEEDSDTRILLKKGRRLQELKMVSGNLDGAGPQK